MSREEVRAHIFDDEVTRMYPHEIKLLNFTPEFKQWLQFYEAIMIETDAPRCPICSMEEEQARLEQKHWLNELYR